MNRHEVNQVTHFAPPGRGHHFVDGKVNLVQNIAESLISHCREESEIAVNNPFKARAGILARDFGGEDQRQLPQPPDIETSRFEYLRVVNGGRRNSFFAITEKFDIAGIASRIAIQRGCSRDVAFRVPVCREQPENFGLNLREWHRRPARSFPPDAALHGRPRYATPAPQQGRPLASERQVGAYSRESGFRIPQRLAGKGA